MKSKYKKGEVVLAKITKLEKYGAFAQIDDEYSGLIHISEMTNGFVRDISDYVAVGDMIYVKIIDISQKNNQLKLSAKDVNPSLHKNTKRKIKETVFGFYLLKTALPNWIEEKIKEINKNK